jgi:prepilin-type N-terminal cleavage/methylation domain-containing protein
MFKHVRGFTFVELIVGLVILGMCCSLIVGGGSQLFLNHIVEGKVNSIEKLVNNVMMTNSSLSSQMFSFAVEIENDEDIITFSTEDRQFATVKPGDKIKVKVFQYPFWNIGKAGTYYNGRLLKKIK